ncbi:MAG: translation elongation factor Ts, partial [Pseudomonadales bacterium]|nr:translation elongation factor Ts [Pseudomonadales bacterium]
AAEGIAVVKVADDNKSAVIVEINSETDFAAREANFLGFANLIAEKAFEAKQTDVAVLMAGDLEKARTELVQKIGENISVRRIEFVEGDVVSAYTHGAKIAAVTVLTGGTAELAKDISMHIAASNPQFLSPSEISEEVFEREKEVIRAQSEGSG